MVSFGRRKGGDGGKPTSGAGGISFEPPVVGDVATTTDEGVVTADDGVASSEGVAATADPIEPTAQDAAAPAERPSRRFGMGRGVSVAKTKEPRAARPGKAARVKIEEEIPLPLTVIIDFYQGVMKESEADPLVRANIEKSFDAPNAAFYYMQRWREGMAVEMQEGGGRAYLPEVLAKLDEDADALIALPMSNRVAQVRLDPDTRSLETLLLLNNQEPPAGAFIAMPTRAMRPFDRRGSKLFVVGVALLGMSVISALASVGAFFMSPSGWALPYLVTTDVKTLPAGQQPAIQAALQQGDCIYKMEFTGVWKVTPGYDDGGRCSATRRAASSATTDPTVPPSGVPGLPGAPGAVPGVVGVPGRPPIVPGASALPVPIGGATGPSGVVSQPVVGIGAGTAAGASALSPGAAGAPRR